MFLEGHSQVGKEISEKRFGWFPRESDNFGGESGKEEVGRERRKRQIDAHAAGEEEFGIFNPDDAPDSHLLETLE